MRSMSIDESILTTGTRARTGSNEEHSSPGLAHSSPSFAPIFKPHAVSSSIALTIGSKSCALRMRERNRQQAKTSESMATQWKSSWRMAGESPSCPLLRSQIEASNSTAPNLMDIKT